jgi:hypothetical protein
MAASTGPAENNTISIQQVELGDTFNLWKDVTNTATYKINKLKIYDATTTSSIAASVSTGGTLSLNLADNVNKGLTFQQPVLFSSGVTFNGNVTFNSGMVTLNANIVTIDDYNIVLGDTAAASDTNINTAGGGGILLNRGSGATAEWLWQTTQVHGITGVWRANTHIGFSGPTSGIYPHNGGSLRVHGSGLQIDGGSTGDHGVLFNLTSTGVGGTTSNRIIELSRYSPTGATVFMEVLNGTTYGAQPFVNIRNGANRKRVTQTAHGLSFGTPVYINGSGAYKPADCTSETTAEVVGVVSNLVDANNFEVTFIGEIYGNFSNALLSGSNLSTGSVYYLSTSAGKLNLSPSKASGTVHKAVFVATGVTGAVVIPFTGGLLAEDVIITTASTVGRSVAQLNKFRIGDAVRWVAGSAGLSYAFTPGPGFTSATYADGIYVKAQANSATEAEVVGIVTDVTEIPSTKVNFKFTLTTDGYYTGAVGLCATNGTVAGNAVAGVQYFLNVNCAGNTQALDNNSAPSFTNTPPTTVGQVRKPLIFTTTAQGGHIISYRGDVFNASQSSFAGYTGSLPEFADLPAGSIVMGTTGSILSPNTGVTLYYHNSGGLSGEYGIYLGASTTGVTINGIWRTRGRAIDRGTTGVTAYHLCQRIS